MGYYAQSFNKSRSYRPRRYRRRRPRTNYSKASAVNLNSVARTAAQAYKYGKIAMSLINTETKHHEVNNPVVNVPVNTWTVQQIADVAQGDTELTRDGGKIRAKSILIKGQLNRSGTNTFPLNQVRIAIVQALTDNRTANDVYSPSNGNTIIAPRNLAAATQYKVLWDKTFSLTNTGGNQGVVIDKYIQIDQHICFPVTIVR